MSEIIGEILSEMGYDLLERGNNYRTKPLYRDSDSNDVLSIDKESGVWYDFKEKRGGKFEELVKLSLKQEDCTQTKEWLKTRMEQHTSMIEKKKPELKAVKKYPKELLLKLERNHSYWADRNIREETVEIFEGGIANVGQMANRYVFPIFNSQNDLVGFTGRYLKDIPDDYNIPKWKHIGSVSYWCYPLKFNLKDIQEKKEIILVESVGDMLALWDADIRHVMVTFGLKISKAITLVLLRMDIQNIIISFNNDSRNNFAGNKAAKEEASKLRFHFDREQIKVMLPNKNDFGEMTRAEILQWYAGITRDV